MKTITELLAPIEARLAAATPGPWIVDRPWLSRGVMTVSGVMPVANMHPEEPYQVVTIHNHGSTSAAKHVAVPEHGHDADDKSDAANNMELIAHAPTDLSTLISLAKRQEAALIVADDALVYCQKPYTISVEMREYKIKKACAEIQQILKGE